MSELKYGNYNHIKLDDIKEEIEGKALEIIKERSLVDPEVINSPIVIEVKKRPGDGRTQFEWYQSLYAYVFSLNHNNGNRQYENDKKPYFEYFIDIVSGSKYHDNLFIEEFGSNKKIIANRVMGYIKNSDVREKFIIQLKEYLQKLNNSKDKKDLKLYGKILNLMAAEEVNAKDTHRIVNESLGKDKNAVEYLYSQIINNAVKMDNEDIVYSTNRVGYIEEITNWLKNEKEENKKDDSNGITPIENLINRGINNYNWCNLIYKILENKLRILEEENASDTKEKNIEAHEIIESIKKMLSSDIFFMSHIMNKNTEAIERILAKGYSSIRLDLVSKYIDQNNEYNLLSVLIKNDGFKKIICQDRVLPFNLFSFKGDIKLFKEVVSQYIDYNNTMHGEEKPPYYDKKRGCVKLGELTNKIFENCINYNELDICEDIIERLIFLKNKGIDIDNKAWSLSEIKGIKESNIKILKEIDFKINDATNIAVNIKNNNDIKDFVKTMQKLGIVIEKEPSILYALIKKSERFTTPYKEIFKKVSKETWCKNIPRSTEDNTTELLYAVLLRETNTLTGGAYHSKKVWNVIPLLEEAGITFMEKTNEGNNILYSFMGEGKLSLGVLSNLLLKNNIMYYHKDDEDENNNSVVDKEKNIISNMLLEKTKTGKTVLANVLDQSNFSSYGFIDNITNNYFDDDDRKELLNSLCMRNENGIVPIIDTLNKVSAKNTIYQYTQHKVNYIAELCVYGCNEGLFNDADKLDILNKLSDDILGPFVVERNKEKIKMYLEEIKIKSLIYTGNGKSNKLKI